MLVEISETTLAAIEKFDTQGRTDMSVDQWAEFKMSAVSICNNLHFDVEMTKHINTMSNDYAQEQVDTARTLEAGE